MGKINDTITRLEGEFTPRELYELHQALEGVVRSAEYPRLVVGTNDEGAQALLDPDSGKETKVISVDIAYRWTNPSDALFDEQAITVMYDGYGDYEGFVYLTEDTNLPVRLPEGWIEETL